MADGGRKAKLAAAFPPGVAEHYAERIDVLDRLIDEGHCTLDEACAAIVHAHEIADAIERGELRSDHGEDLMVRFALIQSGKERPQ